MSKTFPSVRHLLRLLAVALLVTGWALISPAPAQAHGRAGAGTIGGPAFLQPRDVGGVAVRPAADGYAVHLRPPLPGGARRYHSQAALRAQGAVVVDYPTATFHTTVLEHVATYRGAGAARYLHEVRRALACGGRTDRAGRWTIAGTGRNSLLLRLRERWADPDGQPLVHTTYVLVARVGHTVVTLADLGWEYGSGHPATVRHLIRPALHRASALGRAAT